MRLLTQWFGAFLLEGDEVVQEALFPKDPAAIAARLLKMDDWEVLDEERRLTVGLDTFLVHEPRLEKVGGTLVEAEPPVLEAEAYGFPVGLLHDALLEVGRRRMRAAPGPGDHMTQAVEAHQDVTRALNLLRERLRRWYGLHAPELERLVSPSRYAALVAANPDRESLEGVDLSASVGGPLEDADAEELAGLAQMIQQLESRRERLEAYLIQRAESLTGNLAHVVGPLLAARLVSIAGSLEKLARMPASTVQTLGAERALFRHLKTGRPPPKHGVLFQHPLVHTAPWWQRGKIARVLAAKAVIAARADWAGSRDVGESLKASVLKAVETIRKKYPSPPKRKGRPRGR